MSAGCRYVDSLTVFVYIYIYIYGGGVGGTCREERRVDRKMKIKTRKGE